MNLRNFHLDADPDLNLGGGDPQPFSVSREDWDKTQTELNQLREYPTKFSELEKSHNEMRERFKPFLEGGGNKDENKRPNRAEYIQKYGNTPETIEKFIEDLSGWKANELKRSWDETGNKSRQEQEEAARQTQETNRILSYHIQDVEKVKATRPDFKEKVENSAVMRLPDNIKIDIMDSENTGLLTLYLAENPDQLSRLYNAYSESKKKGERLLAVMADKVGAGDEIENRTVQAARIKPTEKVVGRARGKSGVDSDDPDEYKKFFSRGKVNQLQGVNHGR